MASQPGIVLFRGDYMSVRDVLSQDQKGTLLDALMDGVYDGDDQLVRMAYNIFSAAIQRTEEKYLDRRKKNEENARKRWEQYKRMQSDAIAYERMQSDAYQTQSQIQTQGQKTKSKREIFIPPTVEDVKTFCRERENNVDPDTFVDYYAARGWELKPGQKMKDWKAAVRTWERNKRGWSKVGNLGDAERDRVPGQRELYGI